MKILNHIIEENTLKGGYADGKSDLDIANKHNVPLEDIKKQLKLGIEVEKEHTTNEEIAIEIAKDHLYEIPYYYTKLLKMESDAKKIN